MSKLNFSYTGEGITGIIRDNWVSYSFQNAIDICQSMGMTLEQSILMCTGKMKLVGDSRENADLFAADDDTTEVSGIKLSLDAMVERFEKKYISSQEAINLFSDYCGKNQYNEDELSWCQDSLTNEQKTVKHLIKQLDLLYNLAGYSFDRLPTDKIRPAHVIVKEREEEDLRQKKLTEPQTDKMFGGSRWYLSPLSIDKCKDHNIGSGWLLPDGKFYGGAATPFVHDAILFDLRELKIYDYSESGAEEAGWLKLSGGHGWLNYAVDPTHEQIMFMIEFAEKVCGSDEIDLYGHHVKLDALRAYLLGEFDEFDIFKLSDYTK